MPQLHILHALIDWLHAHNKSTPEIDCYVALLSQLQAHDSLPCPKCYLDESAETKVQPLIAFKKEGRLVPLLCVHCKTRFMAEIPG